MRDDQAGEGRPPIVIVPGAWTTAEAFADVRAAFEERGHRAEVLDLPARARRVPQLERGGLAAIDRALDELLDAGDGPPVLVGHSLGGLVALRAARRRPLAGLVLLMPAPPTGLLGPMLGGAVRRPLNTVVLLSAAISMRLSSRLTSATPAGMYSADVTPETLRRASAFRADESWSVLARLLLGSREAVRPTTVPTLVVGGAQDLVTPPAVVERLAGELRATYLELDVAHAFNEEPSFPVVTDAVLEFLTERGRTAAG